MNSENAPIIIIGTGLAAYTLMRDLRKADPETPIIMLTQDDGSNYSKPMLSTGFTKDKTAQTLVMKDAATMAETLKCDIRTKTVVTSLDTDKQSLELEDGSSLSYSKLVLATGSYTITPPIKGDAADEVFSVNDLEDYSKFRDALTHKNAKDVVIIGGGLIGCEFTNDLLNGGFNTTAIDPLAYCLPTLLPEPAGKAVQRALEADGGKFIFGALVTEVNKAGDKYAVTLDNGDVIECDLVLSAIGVRARIDLAQAAGIECNRGIVVDRTLQTSAKNVYALGDCAEVAGHLLFYVLPLMNCARALAKTLSGTETPVSYPAMPVGIKTPSCPVTVSPPAHGAEGEWEIEEEGNNVKALFKNANGELLGFALTGDKTAEKMALQKELPKVLP